MATEMKTVAIVLLKGTNYPTWCQMALVRERLWGIVAGTETIPEGDRAPTEAQAESCSKFLAHRDRALATIVLAVDPSLFYLLGKPTEPMVTFGGSFKTSFRRLEPTN